MAPAERQTQEPLPFFQPIVSVANGRIFAYEALGRQRDARGRITSLGPFFHDPDIPLTHKLDLDRQVRRAALERFQGALPRESDPSLFLNVNPQWLHRHKVFEDLGTLPTVKLLQDLGFDGRRVVIEITEEELFTSYDDVIPLLDQYRAHGMRIAIDDFYFQHFDRLIELKPDFVKLDLRLLRKSVENPDYQKLVNTISAFSRAIGISVIFEGIETPVEMEAAIAAGASHAQGYFFSQPGPDFQDPDRYRDSIYRAIESTTDPRFERTRQIIRLEKYMNSLVRQFVVEESVAGGSGNECDFFLKTLGEVVPANCFRMYICDDQGIQASSNFDREHAAGPFLIRGESAGSRWSWRPYFIEGLIRMQEHRAGVISDPYIDVESRLDTITFSYPLNERLFLFLDFENYDRG